MSKGTAALLILFVILTWAGAGGIAYGVVQSVEGPQGEQGLQGEQGEKGVRGVKGSTGSSSTDSGTIRALERFARMWASTTLSLTNQEPMSTLHPQVTACVQYIKDGTGSGAECGFTRTE